MFTREDIVSQDIFINLTQSIAYALSYHVLLYHYYSTHCDFVQC